jgi:predicted tellurium resistance membrane protein TerC
MAAFTSAEGLVSLLTLTLMEIVLGIDNIIFISILVGRLPAAQAQTARLVGLSLALVMRIGLLFAISWIMSLEADLFTIAGNGFSGRDLILLGGGLFLVAKATHEIFELVEEHEAPREGATSGRTFGIILLQILALDLVFSLDSVITAVGMAKEIVIMIAAMVIAVVVMLVFSGAVSSFIERHPSMRVLALSFLLLIGVMLVADGLGQHISRGYIYFAMGFSLMVQLIDMWSRKGRDQKTA